jgi:peptidoglycan-associated lipoprotein
MTRRTAALLTALSAASLLGACATKPKPLPPTPMAETPVAPTQEDRPAQAGGVRPGSQEDLAATAGDRVYFDLDSHDLAADARAGLLRQVAWLNRYGDARVTIAGNCDERGTREYNLALGARRASAVRDFLVANGISAGRITTISYGKERPQESGSGEEAWARNRNGHTLLLDAVSRGW